MKRTGVFFLLLVFLAGAGLAFAGPSNDLVGFAQAKFGLTSKDIGREYQAARVGAVPATLPVRTQVVLVGRDAYGGFILMGHDAPWDLKKPLAGRIWRLNNGRGSVFFPESFPLLNDRGDKLLFIFVVGLPVNGQSLRPRSSGGSNPEDGGNSAGLPRRLAYGEAPRNDSANGAFSGERAYGARDDNDDSVPPGMQSSYSQGLSQADKPQILLARGEAADEMIRPSEQAVQEAQAQQQKTQGQIDAYKNNRNWGIFNSMVGVGTGFAFLAQAPTPVTGGIMLLGAGANLLRLMWDAFAN